MESGFFLSQRFDLNGLALSSAEGDHVRSKKGRALFGLSLCAGAGGLDLGLHIALPDYRTVCYVERESFAASTLVGRMENEALDRAPVWDDVKTFRGKAWRGVVDIVHGGYPCQPFSIAGRQLGDKDPRHLWPDIARIVSEIKPPLCFFENVGGHLRLGFEQVHDDLRRMGYRVKAGLFTAEEVGTPHKRERLFILAYSEGVFGERGITQRDLGWEPEGQIGSERGDVVDPARAGDERKTGKLHKAQRRPDGSVLRIAHGADGSLADSNGNGFSRAAGAVTGEDDPQGRAQCFANAELGGNGAAAGRVSLHEAGFGKSQKRRSLPDCKGSMADTARAGARQHKRGSRAQLDRGQQSMADASIDGLQGAGQSLEPLHSKANGHGEAGQSFHDGASDGLPIWPPAPADHDGWEGIPASLKPAICRMADGMAYRVDRLRLCGNGVVPLVAAYAFCTLATEAITETGTK